MLNAGITAQIDDESMQEIVNSLASLVMIL